VAPSFTIAASPNSVAVRRGGSVDFQLRLAGSTAGSTVRVTLSGLPRGARATVTGTLSATSPVNVSVRVGRDVRLGTYRLVFHANAAGLTQTTSATLVVTKTRTSTFSLGRLFRAYFFAARS
jgi:hypothetical protein